MCPFYVATLLGRYFVKKFTVITGHDWKYNFLIALIRIDLNELNGATWGYCTKSVWFVMWYTLLILYYISLSRCILFFYKGALHNTVALYLVPVKRIFLPL